jgi:hypothetical protein
MACLPIDYITLLKPLDHFLLFLVLISSIISTIRDTWKARAKYLLFVKYKTKEEKKEKKDPVNLTGLYTLQ